MAMSCGINSLSNRIEIYEEVKTANGSGGFSILDTLLYTVWAGVEFIGSEDEDSGARLIRSNEYKVKMRISPIMDTKRAVNKMKFTIPSVGTIYPKEFKIGKDGLVTFTCLDRHED